MSRQCLTVALLALTLLAGSWSALPRPASAQASDEVDPIDLAAIVLTPGDLDGLGGDAGGAGWGVTDDRLESRADLARAFAAGSGRGADDVADTLDRLTVQRRYGLSVGASTGADGDAADRLVITSVTQLADAEQAPEALDLLLTLERRETVEGLDGFGDETVVTATGGGGPGGSYVGRAVTFRLDRLVVRVSLLLFGTDEVGDEVDLRAAVATVADRTAAALDGDGPQLSARVARYDAAPAGVASEGYFLLGGGYLPGLGEAPADQRSTVAGYGGATDVYGYRLNVTLDGAPAPADPGALAPEDRTRLTAFVYAFPDEDAAAAFVSDEPGRLADMDGVSGVSGVSGVETVAGAPAYGDESVTLSYEDASGEVPLAAWRVTVRSGSLVARLTLLAADRPSSDTLAVLVDAQAGCLESGACAGFLAPPAQLSPERVADPAATPEGTPVALGRLALVSPSA
jgi:hypothetical protein